MEPRRRILFNRSRYLGKLTEQHLGCMEMDRGRDTSSTVDMVQFKNNSSNYNHLKTVGLRLLYIVKRSFLLQYLPTSSAARCWFLFCL